MAEAVPGENATFDEAKIRLRSSDTHSSVWEDSSIRKQRFVGCAVILAESQQDCNRITR